MTKEEYWFRLCTVADLYRDDIAQLLKVFSGPEEIFDAGAEKIMHYAGLPEALALKIAESGKNDLFRGELEKIKRNGIDFIYPGCGKYPERLKNLKDAPFCLYVKGRLPREDRPCAGMVGARACSDYGKEYGRKFAKALAREEVQIVSGMAMGIDSVCAEAAIRAGGTTFAILGGGVDVIYPRENIELYYRIIETGGGIISEYPMGAPPIAWQFPLRNRLISGFSDRLLIIEAAKRSGTLTTAMYALEQGKFIYALPGRVNDRLSQGCNSLIADGAGVLLDTETVINDFYSSGIWKKTVLPGEEKPESFSGGFSDFAQRKVIMSLGTETAGTETIAAKTGLTLETVTEALSELELDGFVVRTAADCFEKSC